MISYSESFCQTDEQDPIGFITSFKSPLFVFDEFLLSDAGYSLKSNNRKQSNLTHKPAVIDNTLSRDEEADGVGASSLEQNFEFQRRLNPATPEDFETLQKELLMWRRREEQKITLLARNREQKKALYQILLNREACLLWKIDYLKKEASNHLRNERTENKWEKCGQMKKWKLSDGSCITVDTVETRRARETKEIYNELGSKVDSVQQRIESLERAKVIVEALNQCKLTKEVCALLDRELELLRLGTELGKEFLQGLRKRIVQVICKLMKKLKSDTADITC
mmetsp:Transcript_12665/g.26920  ORF Transcript_12665/g.26920 Transcript_12665/m.26920 type:complete len:281 (+) Transcript_12665:87-929(+)